MGDIKERNHKLSNKQIIIDVKTLNLTLQLYKSENVISKYL